MNEPFVKDLEEEVEIIYVEEQAPEPWTIREPIYDKDLPSPSDSDGELGRIRVTSKMVPSPLMRLKSPSSDAEIRRKSDNDSVDGSGRISPFPSPLPVIDVTAKSHKRSDSGGSSIDDLKAASASETPVLHNLFASPLSSADMADIESNVSMDNFEDDEGGEEAVNEEIKQNTSEFETSAIDEMQKAFYADNVHNLDESISYHEGDEFHPIPLEDDLLSNEALVVGKTENSNDRESIRTVNTHEKDQINEILYPIAKHSSAFASLQGIVDAGGIERPFTPDPDTAISGNKLGSLADVGKTSITEMNEAPSDSHMNSQGVHFVNNVENNANSAGISSINMDKMPSSYSHAAQGTSHETQKVKALDKIDNSSSGTTSNFDKEPTYHISDDGDIKKHVTFNDDILDDNPSSNKEHVTAFLSGIPKASGSNNAEKSSNNTLAEVIYRLNSGNTKQKDSIDSKELKESSSTGSLFDNGNAALIGTAIAGGIATASVISGSEISSGKAATTVEVTDDSELNENNVFTSDIAATGESMTAIKAKLPDDKVTSFQSSSSSSQIRDNYGLESGSTSDVKRELENTAGSEESISERGNYESDSPLVSGINSEAIVRIDKEHAVDESDVIILDSVESTDQINSEMAHEIDSKSTEDRGTSALKTESAEISTNLESITLVSDSETESSDIPLANPDQASDSDVVPLIESLSPHEAVKATSLLNAIITSELPELSEHLESLGIDADTAIQTLSSNPNLRKNTGEEEVEVNDLVEDSVNFLMFNSDELMAVKTKEEALEKLNKLHNYDETLVDTAALADTVESADYDRIAWLKAKTRNADDLLKQLADLIKELNEEIVALTDENNLQRQKINELQSKKQ